MAFCKNCGAELAKGGKFCTSCGTAIEADAPILTHAPVYESVSYNDEPEDNSFYAETEKTYYQSAEVKNMSFVDAVKSAYENYANFNGRARRKEYWYFLLFNFVVALILSSLAQKISFFAVIYSIWALATFIPSIAVCWRRLHDIGYSGARWFLGLIPIVGAILLTIWFARDGQKFENQYGPVVK